MRIIEGGRPAAKPNSQVDEFWTERAVAISADNDLVARRYAASKTEREKNYRSMMTYLQVAIQAVVAG